VQRTNRLFLAVALAVGVTLGAARPIVAQSDRTRAAEHFALAQSAEARKDWRAAIAEYEEAYRLAPHPSVLFNIAVDYERLGEKRTAVRYFLRYVDGSPEADDRQTTLRRIEGLRRAPSTVQFTANPEGATIVVDGEEFGTAPLTLTLEAGSHKVQASHDGRRSMARQIVLEYGEPMAIQIDLFALPGLLKVDADRPGAEVRIDGQVVGVTPYAGAVPSGEHQVVITLAGFLPAERQVTVPHQGSAQIRATLEPIPGVAVVEPARPKAGDKFLLGTAYGFTAGSEEGVRYSFDLGYRTAGDRLELTGLLGYFGTTLGAGVGLSARAYLGTGRMRPYLRGGVLRGAGEVTMAFEAGAGLLVTGDPREPHASAAFGVEYFLEIAYQFRDGGGDDDVGPGGGSSPRVVGPLGAAVLPVIVGVSLRFGS
jgi:hypothetical protein